MSYIAYINGKELELTPASPIAYTKQVNDIARLDNRQSNFTHKFTLPFTATNQKAMEHVYIVGNQSNIPYQKNVFDLIDADSGVHLIYKGWATVIQTTGKGYDINVYDGYIDFFKAIENKTLTDVDITALNHLKNLSTVVNSFTANLPYKYIIADYNGKNLDMIGTPSSTTAIDINIDYQVPSAKVSFIWNRIFAFFGYTFSGSVFDTDEFKNLYMTFPKPVPDVEPITTLITNQSAEIRINTVAEPGPTPGSLEYVNFYYIVLFPNAFTTSYANHTASSGFISITTSGSYRIKANGSFCNNFGCVSDLNWQVRNSSNVIMSSGTFQENVIISANAGDKVYISSLVTGQTSSAVNNPVSGAMDIYFEHIDGFDASFSEALIDFKVTDFMNEIMQRFGLTQFKEKFSNHIEFLTLKEILDSAETLDWSDKFSEKVSERYIYGKYAQRNNFKYRYNDENDKHNDGYITVNNENLNDEVTIISSKIYSPAKGGPFYGNCAEVFKFWDKEIKDDGDVKYKDLDGRYYYLRLQDYSNTTSVKIGSKVLNQQISITDFPVASYHRLAFQDIIEDNYLIIESLLNKSKVIDVSFFLKPKDVADFNFKKLIYIEQLSSYYLVNKIPNFVKGKVTKCEIIEVDKGSLLSDNPTPTVYTLQLTTTNIDSCNLIIDVITNLPQPISITVIFEYQTFGLPSTTPPITVLGTLDNNQIIIPLNQIQSSPIAYLLSVTAFNFSPYISVNSNVINQIVTNNCYNPQYITVSSFSILPGGDMQINFTTNIPFPFDVSLSGSRIYPDFNFFFPITVHATGSPIIVSGVPSGSWTYQLQSSSGIKSNEF